MTIYSIKSLMLLGFYKSLFVKLSWHSALSELAVVTWFCKGLSSKSLPKTLPPDVTNYFPLLLGT